MNKLWRQGYYRARDGSMFLYLSTDFKHDVIRLMWLDERSHKNVPYEEVSDAVWLSPPNERPGPRRDSGMDEP